VVPVARLALRSPGSRAGVEVGEGGLGHAELHARGR
jgi:hypothetical protein